MWLMLQQDVPEDYVLATGITTTVRDFIRMAFGYLGVDIRFEGEGLNEKGIIVSCKNSSYQIPEGKEVVHIHPKYFRAAEVDYLIGDATKAKTKLGWEPKYDLKMLVEEMIQSDVDALRKTMRNG
jgi:GDPmannose 4,6-dehydratase